MSSARRELRLGDHSVLKPYSLAVIVVIIIGQLELFKLTVFATKNFVRLRRGLKNILVL